MYLRSIFPAAIVASLGLASTVQAATIVHEKNYFVPITQGHPFFVDRYQIIVEKGDSLESIARQFREMDVGDYDLTGPSPITADKLWQSNPGSFPYKNNERLHRGRVFHYNRISVVPICNGIL